MIALLRGPWRGRGHRDRKVGVGARGGAGGGGGASVFSGAESQVGGERALEAGGGDGCTAVCARNRVKVVNPQLKRGLKTSRQRQRRALPPDFLSQTPRTAVGNPAQPVFLETPFRWFWPITHFSGTGWGAPGMRAGNLSWSSLGPPRG